MTPAGIYGRGTTPATRLGWASEASQRAHHDELFRLLSAHVPLRGLRVRDVGCGDGAAVPYVLDRGGLYVGCDSRPEAVAEARSRHPDAAFVVADGSDRLAPVDVSVAVGTLAHHDEASALRLLRRMLATSRRAVAFTAWHGVVPWSPSHSSCVAVERALVRAIGSRPVFFTARPEVETRYYVVRTDLGE